MRVKTEKSAEIGLVFTHPTLGNVKIIAVHPTYPELYPLEYRQTRCLVCSESLANHRRFTAEDIAATAGATYDNPINGYRSPLSPKLVGEWRSHTPMPWKESAWKEA